MEFVCTCLQKLPEASEPAERYPDHSTELCRLPEAEELAVVATVYEGECGTEGLVRDGAVCGWVGSWFTWCSLYVTN